MKLLIIEDEADLLKVLKKYFIKKGYVVDTASDGLEGFQMYEINNYDLIILDLNLPSMDGIEILSNIRKNNIMQRILILSARVEIEDRILGFDMGTNDYLPKPFSILELDARVRALLRFEVKQQNDEISCGKFKLNMASKTIFINNKIIELAPREYAILEYLIINHDKVVSTETLIEHVWNSEIDMFTESVKVHISNLRKKIKAKDIEDGIVTVRGHGYTIKNKR
ncbi:MAG: response regulator transcription factor [Romboutsia sp.]